MYRAVPVYRGKWQHQKHTIPHATLSVALRLLGSPQSNFIEILTKGSESVVYGLPIWPLAVAQRSDEELYRYASACKLNNSA